MRSWCLPSASCTSAACDRGHAVGQLSHGGLVALYRQTLTVIVSGAQLVLGKRSPEELPPDRLAALQKEVQLQADLNPPPATLAARKLDSCVQLFNSGCYADAISTCDQVIALGAMAGPALRQAYINRAAIPMRSGMVPDAVKTLKRAIQNGLDDQVIRSEAERFEACDCGVRDCNCGVEAW